ncbi:MAG TPA: DDE-type integrase/transposase/recombinase [Candidatus Dormibacteraeota bacterium]|nr:DDE-type integrase/transposase/recombinase [Candidatus Dormibacteraeota bacterium]
MCRQAGTGIEQPPEPHQHWHIDVSCLNVFEALCYLCSILDGCSLFLVYWDLREQMTEAYMEIILERAKERYPGVRPRIISDSGPQFIAKDLQEFIRPGTPLSLEDARRLVKGYVEFYNNVRLSRAIGYITPKDMLAGHLQEIEVKRNRKLEAAREQRKNRRHYAA